MKGFLNINKPAGMTSSDVICKIRKILGIKTVGHMGTLDPQGVGVLPIGVGKAARLFNFMLNKDKEYEAEFTFGYETDTLDADGSIILEHGQVPSIKEIENVLQRLIGEVEQLPPKYSAKSVDGRRAYDLARKGIPFELKKAQVKIYTIKLLQQTNQNTFRFFIHCSSGTYIRSICRDLAYSLNTYATMTAIKRLRSGYFKIADSIELEALKLSGESSLIPIDCVIKDLPKIELPDEFHLDLVNGKKINFSSKYDIFSLYCKNELFGLATVKDGFLKIITYLRD